MLSLSIITLIIATLSAFLSFNTSEEVVRVAMASMAVVCAFLTLVCAPWLLKLTLVAIPLLLVSSRWSVEN